MASVTVREPLIGSSDAKGYGSNRPASSKKTAPDGTPILKEAECDSGSLCGHVWIFSVMLLVVTFFVATPLMIFPLFCSFRALVSWRLYLTPFNIHYTEIGPYPWICMCRSYKKMVIPLMDIEHVHVHINSTCGRDDYSLMLRIHPSKVDPYIANGWASNGCIELAYVVNYNAPKFAEHVAGQMAAVQLGALPIEEVAIKFYD